MISPAVDRASAPWAQVAVAAPAPSEAALDVEAAEEETFGELAGEALDGKAAAEKGAEAVVGLVGGS